MFAPEVTAKAVEETSRRLGFDLVYHSQAQIDSARSLLDDLMDPDRGGLKRNLAPDEVRFITNERALCALDFRSYWLPHYSYIIDKDKRPCRCVPNVAQNVMLDIWSESERKGEAIWTQNLKARRLGISTIAELKIQHAFQFLPFTNAVVASADPDKTVEMAGVIKFCLDDQPWWLKPVPTKIYKGMPIEHGEIHTNLTIQAGNQFNGVARGSSPNYVHLCLAPHTLIRVANGMLKPIIEIQPGDQVITHTGKIARVKHVARSPRSNELGIDLWVWGTCAPLAVTRDHRVRTSSGWVEAKDLHDGDWVVHPVRTISHERTTFTAIKRSTGQPFQQKITPLTFPLSRDWGWLCGLYLAEGTPTKNSRKNISRDKTVTGMVFSGDLSEVEKRTNRLKLALGVDQPIGVQRTTSRTRMLRVSHSGIGRWVVENFGETDTKRVPDWAWQAGREFCLGIVEGYLHGDGHFATQDDCIYASSVRVQLPIQIRDLIASLGFGWAGITYRQEGFYYGRNCRAQWTMVINSETARRIREASGRPVRKSVNKQGQQPHWRYTSDGHLELEIERATDNFSETFYDIEVDDPDHSFTTAQCAVSNSELCEWVDAADLIDGALLPAIIDNANVFGMLESTANGDGWWKKKWEQNKRDWPRGRGRIRPVFLPWYVGVDIYPTPADRRKRPVPTNWVPTDRTIAHAERARQYVLSNPLLFQHLAKNDSRWEMPRDQMWWREMGYETAKEEKSLHIFFQEFCADDFEAFQSHNVPVIDPEILMGYQERTRAPIAVYTVVGPDIPPAMVTPRRYWDTSKPTITIATRDLMSRFDVKYQFIPLHFHGYDSFEEDLKLLIWEYPQDGDTYGIGVDCSEGIGQDNAVVEVLREARIDRAPGQVAEWASNRVTAFQLWPLTLAVACFYSTYSTRMGHRAQAKLAIETVTNGASLQNELKKRGWTNFHVWKYNGTKKPIKDANAYREGILTNAWFRATMMDMLLTSLSEEAIDVPSPYLVKELTTLEKVIGVTKAVAASGSHDDRVMAIGFPLVSLHQGKAPAKQFARRRVEYAPGLESDEGVAYPIWTPPAYSFGSAPMAMQPVQTRRGKFQLERAINSRMPGGFR